MKKVKIIIGSITYATKLRRLLSRDGIESRIIKSDKNGCIHGVEIDQVNYYATIVLLRKNGIEYSVE